MLTSSFPRYPGDGAGVFVYELSDHLTRHGCDITVLAPHAAGSRFKEIWSEGKLTIERFRYFYPQSHQRLCYGAGIVKNIRAQPVTLIQAPFFLAAQTAALVRLARQQRVDIVHAHWSIPQGLVAWLGRHLIQAPYIVSIHGTDVYGLQYPVLSRLNRSICRQAAACTVNSAETGEAAGRMLGTQKFQTIPMGVDTSLFRPLTNDCRQLPNEDSTIRILYVGRLIDWKGVDHLMQAVPRILPIFPKIHLQIVGDGPEKAELQRLAADLGIGELVTFAGNVAHADLASYYQGADVFVLPSCVSKSGEMEGLGVVMLEAMACGLPVVGSNIGGIPQVIKDGVTGLLSDPEDPEAIAKKIITILTNRELRNDLASAAKLLVEKEYSWDVISSKFNEVYGEVLSSQPERI